MATCEFDVAKHGLDRRPSTVFAAEMRMQFAVTVFAAFVALGVPASAQMVRYEITDRMTDKVTLQALLPSSTARAGLLFRCDAVYLVGSIAAPSPEETIVTWRTDQNAAVEAVYRVHTSTQGAPAIVMEQGRGGPLATAVRAARTSLALRIGGPTSKIDVEFPLIHDTRESFAYAAEAAGAPRTAARTGYDHLSLSIIRAVARQDPGFASLMQRLGISLRDGTRTREAWELMPNIIKALHVNAAKPVVEDMGQVIFGFSWPELKPLMKLDAEKYRALRGPASQQLDWLEKACGP